MTSCLLNENHDFLRLAINTVRNDIIGRNETFQCLALTLVRSGAYFLPKNLFGNLYKHNACQMFFVLFSLLLFPYTNLSYLSRLEILVGENLLSHWPLMFKSYL